MYLAVKKTGDESVGKVGFRVRDGLPGHHADRLRGFDRRPRPPTHPDVVDGSRPHKHTRAIVRLRSRSGGLRLCSRILSAYTDATSGRGRLVPGEPFAFDVR